MIFLTLAFLLFNTDIIVPAVVVRARGAQFGPYVRNLLCQ